MAQVIEPGNEREFEWDSIDWQFHEKHVWHLQERIFCKTREKKWKVVKNLQKLLVRSQSARLIAVKRVTQQNSGRFTPGIDGVTCNTNAQRARLVKEIEQLDPRNYRCQPVRRVYIPKPDGSKRPLGIPTIKDRAMQYIVKTALEPEWEARFEPNSYGFRPGRRCQDAINQIKRSIAKTWRSNGSPWILDADISKCFDSIDHEFLLKKVPVFRQVIRRWLRAGVVEFGVWYQTVTGTPQGGIISPLLANIALDGMERLFGIETKSGRYKSPSQRAGMNKGIGLTRYADDFVVTAPSREVILNYVVPKLETFLAERGLILSSVKTRIIHRKEGLNFLGFTLREVRSSFNPEWCIMMPSKESVRKLCVKLKEVLSTHKQSKVDDVVHWLNPILHGWANYFRYSNSKSVFKYVDSRVWMMLWQWCKRRHRDKGKHWIANRYFLRVGNRSWVFGEKESNTLYVMVDTRVSVRAYVQVKNLGSPFDPLLRAYWAARGIRGGCG